MDVSVIIVNYNTCVMTLECIDSIFKWTSGLDFEVIVVDNDSKDNSRTVLGNDGRIKFIESGGNIGFGRANNLALESAKGEYVLLLNSDTVLTGNAVCDMWRFMTEKGGNIGALGTVLQDMNGNDVHSSACFPSPLKSVWSLVKQHFAHLTGKSRKYGMSEISYHSVPESGFFEVDYVTGADLMAKRETFVKYGAFDPEFFLYCEETEMQFRWRRAGLGNYIIPVRSIVHLEGRVVGPLSSLRRIIIQLRSERLYFKKTMMSFPYAIYCCLDTILRLPMLMDRRFDKTERREIFSILF